MLWFERVELRKSQLFYTSPFYCLKSLQLFGLSNLRRVERKHRCPLLLHRVACSTMAVFNLSLGHWIEWQIAKAILQAKMYLAMAMGQKGAPKTHWFGKTCLGPKHGDCLSFPFWPEATNDVFNIVAFFSRFTTHWSMVWLNPDARQAEVSRGMLPVHETPVHWLFVFWIKERQAPSGGKKARFYSRYLSRLYTTVSHLSSWMYMKQYKHVDLS